MILFVGEEAPRREPLENVDVSEEPPYADDTPPTARIYPDSVTTYEGDTVELVCDARGSPTPTVRWYRGHREVVDERHRVILCDF